MKYFLRFCLLLSLFAFTVLPVSATYQVRGSIYFGGLCTNGINNAGIWRSVNGSAFSLLQNMSGSWFPTTPPSSVTTWATASDNSGGGGDSVQVQFRYQVIGGGTNVYILQDGTAALAPGAVYPITFAPTCDGVGITNWCATTTVRNTDAFEHGYVMKQNGTIFCMDAGSFNGNIGSWTILRPGESATMTVCGLANTNGVSVGILGQYGTEWKLQTTGGCVHPVDMGGGAVSAPDATNRAPVIVGTPGSPPSSSPVTDVGSNGSGAGSGTAPNFSGTNSPIPFVNGTNTAKDETLKQGFNTLYNSIEKTTAAINQQGLTLGNKLDGIRDAISSLPVGGGGTGEVGVVDAVNAFHTDNTNLLQQILGKLSETNAAGIPGFSTNYSTLRDTAQGVVDANLDQSGIQSAADSLNGMDIPGSSGTPLNIPLGSFSMEASLMPGEWANVWSFVKKLFSWFLAAAYMVWISKSTFELTATIGTMQQMKLPNISASALGFGGNAGALLYPIFVGIMLIAYGALLGAVGIFISGHSSAFIAAVATNPFVGNSAAVQNGINFISAALPIGLIASLFGAKMLWNITRTQAVAVCAIIFRLLPG